MNAQRPDVHREPFIHLADLAADRALVAWGAFWFTRQPGDRWQIVDDERLTEVAGRRSSIGHRAEPYGTAQVQLLDPDGAVLHEVVATDRTWAWLTGLAPDTEYRYRVLVDGEEWAAGELWDWVASPRGGFDLVPHGRRYDLRFRTWPDPDEPSPRVRFAALGDYGVGIRSDSESSRRQRRIAEVLERAVEEHQVRSWSRSVTTSTGASSAGNHDASDTEGSDDREQLEDNFHISERFDSETDQASVGPGLFYRRRFGRDLELVCLDTSLDSQDPAVHRLFQAPHHHAWLERVFRADSPRWLVPFSHHPVYCAGPHHPNDEEMQESLLPLFERAGVRLVLAGHEHNFQVSEADGRSYVISGAGGKIREDVPTGFAEACTTAWAAQSHLLLVDIDGEEARLTPVSGLRADGTMQPMTALAPDDAVRYPPFVVRA